MISKRSILSSSRPADLTAAGIATAGPTPMTAGSTPTAAKVLQEYYRIILLIVDLDTLGGIEYFLTRIISST